MRLLCAVVAIVVGWVAVSIGASGEFRSKTGVVELSLGARCLFVAVLGFMAAVAGWVTVTGRE